MKRKANTTFKCIYCKKKCEYDKNSDYKFSEFKCNNHGEIQVDFMLNRFGLSEIMLSGSKLYLSMINGKSMDNKNTFHIVKRLNGLYDYENGFDLILQLDNEYFQPNNFEEKINLLLTFE